MEPLLHCTDCATGGHRGGGSPRCPRGLRGAGSPPLRGSGQCPEKFFLDPILGWANLPMFFSVHGFGRDGFPSMVLDASACINMYCNIEWNIMKHQAGSLGFEIQWEISMYMCFMCYALALFIFCVLKFLCR